MESERAHNSRESETEGAVAGGGLKERAQEAGESTGMIKNGLIRIAIAGAAGIVLSQSSGVSPVAYLGVFLALALGILLIPARPALVTDALARVVADVVAVTLVVWGAGGAQTPYILLYFIAALGVVWIERPSKAAAGALLAAVGYVGSTFLSGGVGGTADILRMVLFGVFCLLVWDVAGEVAAIRGRRRETGEVLESERAYAKSVSAFTGSFGPVLRVLDLKGILRWSARTAREATGAPYAHVVLLDGNQHFTSTDGPEREAWPTWWHPVVQEMVLRGSRHEGPLRGREKSVHGITDFIAVPLTVEGSEHNGTLVLGGKDFDESDERMLVLLAEQASSALGGVGEAPGGRDPSTGLPNRASLHQVMEGEVSRGGTLSVISVKLEGLGRRGRSGEGEKLIREVSRRVAGRQRVFRYATDELVVLMRGANDRRSGRVAQWLSEVVGEVIEDSLLSPEVSIGRAMADADYEDADEVVALARGRTSAGEDEGGEFAGEAGGMVAALLEAAAIRDPALEVHLKSVSEMSGRVAEALGLEGRELRSATTGALLHDIGKIGVPDAVYRKPGSLTDAEFDQIKRHTLMGAGVLAQLPELSDVVPVVRHHHERFDGGGYPDGLSGDEIPLGARIVFVCDAYDSMIQDRPYRRGRSPAGAIHEIEQHAGSQFDPRVVGAFLEVMRGREERRGLFSVG